MTFKTQQEIYKALLDGKKVTDGTSIISFNQHGYLMDQDGFSVSFNFSTKDRWHLYTEPKPKVVLYEYMVKNSHVDRNRWLIAAKPFPTDDEAKKYYDASEVKRTGRSFEVES